MDQEIKAGQYIRANVAYKWVPFIQCKPQRVLVILADQEKGIFSGKNENGKTVHFTRKDIIN